MAAGLGTVQANVFTELWLGYSLGEYTSTRGFGTDRIAASLGSITDLNATSARPRRSPRPCWWPMRSRPTLANGPPGRAAIVRGVSRLAPRRHSTAISEAWGTVAFASVRAWQVQRNGRPCDVLRLVEISEPVPGPGELRLLVQAAAVGMPDAFLCRGTYAFNPTLPFVPGQEVCGIVDAVGTDVRIALGTRVMAVTNFYDGRGGFAEVAIARADACYRVPETMSDVDAASFRIGFSTAWIGLVRRAALQAGETLLVLGGAGGSGVAAIQLGLALGARVIAVAAGAAKCNVCAQLGADVVIDRATQVVPDAVLEASGGLGVDVVYDPVGGSAAGATLRCLTRGGRLLAVGFASGEWVLADISVLVRRNASIVGVYAGGLTRAENEADHEALLALAGNGQLKSVANVMSFDALSDAVDAVDAGNAIGKMVVRIADSG